MDNYLATDADMPMLLMEMEAADDLAVDTETSGLNVRNGVDYLTGICIDTGFSSFYLPFRHAKGTEQNLNMRWIEHIWNIFRKKPLTWHNQKFDYHSLKTIGIDPNTFQGKQFDTLLISHLVNEELWSHELDFLLKWYCKMEKVDGDLIHDLAEIYGWANIPPNVIAPYGAGDARGTRALRNKLWPKLVEQGLESVYWDTEQPFTRSLYRMEQRGVGTNRELASSMAERGRARMVSIQRTLRFNPASTVDLGNYLLNELNLPVLQVTPKGKPSFNKMAMEEYDTILQQSSNPAAQLITEFRGWQKATTSLYEPLLRKVGPDGRIRTNFKQHGTVTGRLSSTDPNLQQIPRGSNKRWNGNAKACFTSGIDDFALYGWDYSQVELRLSAAYGRESILLAEFDKPDADPFRVICPLIFGTYSDELRHKTKNCFVYPSLYGAGIAKVALVLGKSVEETTPLYMNYKNGIRGITATADKVNHTMRDQRFITYWDGRRRHIKNQQDSFKAWNSLLQGGAAQLMKKAVLRCEEWADEDCFPVLTVHDEITFCVRREAIPDYEPKVKSSMLDWKKEDGVTNLFPVKFAVDGKEWKAAA
jgi:DNA polymerase-1